MAKAIEKLVVECVERPGFECPNILLCDTHCRCMFLPGPVTVARRKRRNRIKKVIR